MNTSSVQGHIAVKDRGAYAASKAGVNALTRGASEDHVADGIRVNAVCPGYIATPMNGSPEEWEERKWMVDRDGKLTSFF